MNIRNGVSALGLVLQIISVFGVTADFTAELAKKIQEVAARRLAATQGFELPVKKSEPASNAEAKRSISTQGFFKFRDLFVVAPVVQDAAFKSLKVALDKEKKLVGDTYYSVYFSVPREVILKYVILKQLQDYFEEQNYPRGAKIGSLMTYLAQELKGPLRVELNPENLFESRAKKPILMRQRVFGSAEKLSVQDWPQLKPYVQAQTLDDLAAFLNQYVAGNGYDENIVVQLFIPKDRANDDVKAKVFGHGVALDDIMDTDGGYEKDLYAVLSLQGGRNYDDLKTVVIHSLNGSFNSSVDMREQFAPIVEKVGAKMLVTLKNPPAPLPRDTVSSAGTSSTGSSKRPLDTQEEDQFDPDVKRSKTTPPPPLPRDTVAPEASAIPPAPMPEDVEPSVETPKATKSGAQQSLFEQIRQGKELRKTETAAKSKTEEDARVRALEEALARAGVLGASDDQAEDEDTDDEWDEEESVVDAQPQQSTASSQSAPSQQPSPQQGKSVAPQSSKQEEFDAQPRSQEDLQKDLEASLQQRRGALAEDEDDDAMDVEDWDEE